MTRFLSLGLIMAILFLGGCDYRVDNPDYEYEEGANFSPQHIIEQLVSYREEGFELINDTPFASHAIEDAWISIWVSENAADDYRDIRLDYEGSGAEVPVGSIIIREVKDSSGDIMKLTVIARAPDGAHPTAGDLWFATATADGIVEDINHSGFLSTCAGCHVTRASDGFLFGTPTNSL
ncbi:MAG: hypothetical protein ACPGQS_12585 [Bradymonadia bacterium]